jgi:hypothetical protein
VGATGAGVFHLILVGLVVMIAWRPREVFPEEWSIAEIRVWVGLVFGLLLLGFCKLLTTLTALDAVPLSIRDVPARRFISLLGALLFFYVVVIAMLARRGGVQLDERDLRMRCAADQTGDLALALAVVSGAIVLIATPRELLAWWLEPVILANVLIGLLIFRSFVEQSVLTDTLARR